jgi:putative membrane protein
MTSTQGDLAALSRYVFRAPRWYTSTGIALLVAAVTGAGAFSSAYLFEDAVRGVVYIGLPTAVAALLTTPVDRALGGNLTFERSSLLALTGEVVLVVALLGAGLFRILWLGDAVVRESLLAALAFVFALRLVVIVAVSRTSWLAVLPASLQTVAGAAALFVYDGTMRVGRGWLPADPSDVGVAPLVHFGTESLLLLVATSAVFGAATFGFVRVLDRPWKQALGVSVLDFISGFVGHIAEGSHELEEFFAEIGEEALVPVTVLVMRRADGSEKARWTLPMVHPGPMGEIGGGNLPRRLAESAEGLCFPPHATAGHDFNLVSRAEVETLVDAANRATAAAAADSGATRSLRAQTGAATMTGQRFAGGSLLTTTYAPGVADDIAFSVGRTAAAEARSAGLEDVLLVDAHNSNDGLGGEDLGHVTPGSKRAADTVAAAGTVGDALAEADMQALRLGTAWSETDWTAADGIGSLGVRVAAVDTGGQTTAYVLIDGNNMEPGLRATLLRALPDCVDTGEILTTDTHVVNTMQSVNQVGEALDEDQLAALVTDLTVAAVDDLEPVEAGMATEEALVTVFGNDRTETLAAHANAMVAMGAGLAAALGVAAFAVTIVLLAAV